MLAAFLRKRVFEQIGPFETKYIVGDVEFLARAAFREVNMGTIPQIITDYYLTGDNGVFTKAPRIRWDILRINLRYGTICDALYWTQREILPPHVRNIRQLALRLWYAMLKVTLPVRHALGIRRRKARGDCSPS